MKIVGLLSVLFVLLVGNAVAESSVFSVGAILPLTGRSADYGIAARNGIELARKERPDAFGNLRFLYEDSQYDGKTTITTLHRLRSGDDIDIAFVWGHGPCEAVAPVAEAKKIPAFLVSGDYAVARDKSYIIRFFPIHERYGEALATYLRARNYSRVGVVKTEIGFLNHVIDGIRKNQTTGESLTVVDSYQLEITDFKTSIVKLKAREFDAVGVFLAENQVSLFFQQARSLGFAAPTVGSHSFASKLSITETKGAMTGAVFPAIPVDSDFYQRYVAAFGDDIQISFAANAYDFAMLIADLFNADGSSMSANEIMEKVRAIRKRTGVSGEFGYLETPESGAGFDFNIVLREIQHDNSIKTLTELSSE